MAHISLYRKYRPDTFESVIGQDYIVKTLINQIKSGKISHAYLFTGTRGTGKTSTAKIFAKAINCINNQNGSPCHTCQVCKDLEVSSNMDILEIDAASNNSVDEVRDIRDKVVYPPTNCRYKVYIIDEVHMLTNSAFNALLKTLEEPPAHAVFILATTEAHKLPQTILSRCIRFDFRLVQQATLSNHLKSLLTDNGTTYEEEAVMLLAQAGDGSVRDMLSFADMAISYCDNHLTYNGVLEILGANSPYVILELVKAIVQEDIQKALLLIDDLLNKGKNISLLAKDIAVAFRNLIYISKIKNANSVLKLEQELYTKYEEIVDSIKLWKVLRCSDIFAKLDGVLRYSSSPRIVLETTIVSAIELKGDIDNMSLVYRIKALEDKVDDLIKKKISISSEEIDIVVHEVQSIVTEISKMPLITKNAVKLMKPTKPTSIWGRLKIELRDVRPLLSAVCDSVKKIVKDVDDEHKLIVYVSLECDKILLTDNNNIRLIEDTISEFMQEKYTLVCEINDVYDKYGIDSVVNRLQELIENIIIDK